MCKVIESKVQPQPAPLPEDAITDAINAFNAADLSGYPLTMRERMSRALRNFAQRPDVLGPVGDEELPKFWKNEDLWRKELNIFIANRLNRLFAPKEPSMEEEITKILVPFIGNSHAVPRAVESILTLIQHQQGKGKE